MSDIKNILIIGDIFDYTKNVNGLNPQWINSLQSIYNWNIINLSWSGVGSSYNIIKFLKNKEDFDLCIFIWSDVYRTLYHHDVHDLTTNKDKSDYQDLYDAADLYYKHLVNNPITYIEHIALLKGFDAYIKQQYSDKLFWHFYLNTTSEKSENELLFYNFTQGLTIYPTVDKINNMGSDYVCDKLKNVIDTDYTSGVFILNE